jgi:hypothetical protein
MGVMQFLSPLSALLGITGFVVYYFISRNRGGDRITLDIVAKLRREAPERLPPQTTKLDSATLAKLVESDTILRSKVGEQDFQLLRDALRQQFITSVIVYGLCAFIFLTGIGLYVSMYRSGHILCPYHQSLVRVRTQLRKRFRSILMACA